MAVNIVNISTLNRVRLYSGQPGTSEGTLYTVPASTDVKVAQIVLCNTTGSPATVSLSTVASGGTASNTNRLLAGVSVDANAVVVIDLNVYMTAGDFLSGLQGTASAITVTISGETYA